MVCIRTPMGQEYSSTLAGSRWLCSARHARALRVCVPWNCNTAIEGWQNTSVQPFAVVACWEENETMLCCPLGAGAVYSCSSTVRPWRVVGETGRKIGPSCVAVLGNGAD